MGNDKPSPVQHGREVGAEIIAGASWDQYRFATKVEAERFVAWLKRHKLPFQGISMACGKYVVRAR